MKLESTMLSETRAATNSIIMLMMLMKWKPADHLPFQQYVVLLANTITMIVTASVKLPCNTIFQVPGLLLLA